MSNQTIQSKLHQIGFGPSRSVAMAAKAPVELLNKIVSFSDKAQSQGLQFRVFQSSGRNGHYARLRLMLVTGKKPNRYQDSRGFNGPIEELEVGSLGITHAQLAEIGAGIDRLSTSFSEISRDQ